MASIINAATSGGLVTTADTSGVLQLQTASTTAVTVDASQNVGIGTSSPADALNLGTGKKFRATHSASIYQQIFSSGSGNFISAFGDNLQLSADVGAIYLTTVAAQPIVFQTTNTDRLTVLGNGTVKTSSTISVGNATPSTSGAGITFPATASDSSSANTLDDYEEGTWTPTLPNGGTLTDIGSYYTKIGRFVYVSLHLNAIAPTNNGSGFRIGSLPFTASSSSGFYGGGSFNYMGDSVLSSFLPIIENGSTYIFFHQSTGTTAAVTNSGYLTAASGGNDSFIINATYMV